eukprot:172207-Rhodomonas_salina.2
MQVFLATQCDAGASAYVLLEELEDELDKGGAVVEVGSDRGEGSTAFLSSLANRTGREFFSVDFSNEGRQNAEQACGSCAHQVAIECRDITTVIPFPFHPLHEWLCPKLFLLRLASLVIFRQGMGEVWLENEFPKLSTAGTIALAYLDNYDWTYPWTKGMQYKQQQVHAEAEARETWYLVLTSRMIQHVDYNAKGLELSNQRSQVRQFCG